MKTSMIPAFAIFVILLCAASCAQPPPEVGEPVTGQESAQPQEPAVLAELSDPESLVSGGYSIFHETMADMTWQEIEEAAKEGAIVLLPTAVVEEHGPHMGNGVDTYMAYQTCKLARRELETRGIRTLIAPPYFWGRNGTTHVFPGTFTVRDSTMKALLKDTLASLKSWGFTDVFNINWHYDGTHLRTLLQAVIGEAQDPDMNVYFVMPDYDMARFGFSGKEPFLLVHKTPPGEDEPQDYLDLHAGAGETGIMAAYFPDQVDLEMARALEPTRLTMQDVGAWVQDALRVTPLGYLGDPAAYNTEEMGTWHEDFCSGIAESIEGFLKERGYSPAPQSEVSFDDRNYSIFDETMVDMTWQEVEKAAAEGAIVLLNTAVIEEHGPHMVCGIDSYLGSLWCRLTRRKLEARGIPTITAPPFYWGINRSSHVFPGTFTVRDATLEAVLHDTLASLKSWGFDRVFFINSHGDGAHNAVIIEAVKKSRESLDMEVNFLLSEARAARTSLTGKEPHILFFGATSLEASPPQYMDIHAGWLETGIVAAFLPGLVDVELARTLEPTRLSWEDAGRWIKDMMAVTPLGYAGDPAAHDAEAARQYVEELTSNMAAAIAAEIQKK